MKTTRKAYACLDVAQLTALLSMATQDSIKRYGHVKEYATSIVRFPLHKKHLAVDGSMQVNDSEMTVNGQPLWEQAMKFRQTMKAVAADDLNQVAVKGAK